MSTGARGFFLLIMVVDISVPENWQSLTQKQLYCLFRCMSRKMMRALEDKSANLGLTDFDWAEIITRFLIKFNRMKVVGRYGDFFLFKKHDVQFECPPDVWAHACSLMRWVKEIPDSPVRLDNIKNNTPICDIQLTQLLLQDYIALENYWQTFCAYGDAEAIVFMTEILYGCEGVSPDSAQMLSVVYWWSSAKKLLSENFPNFLRPASQDSADFSAVELRRNSDSIIRALTKGDISKNSVILKSTLWVALAELDALAKEYDDLNKKFPNK